VIFLKFPIDIPHFSVGVKFTAGSTELIRQAAHIQIFNNRLYEEVQGKWVPAQYGPLDTRLVLYDINMNGEYLKANRLCIITFQGTFQKSGNCQTCNQGLQECVGHFGFIDLEYPVFHIGFFRLVIQTLQCICKVCFC
jgi:DNA-directed RNA polymerase III subunit RPC1